MKIMYHKNQVPQGIFYEKIRFFLGGHAGVIRYRTSEVTKHIPQCTSTSVFLVYFLEFYGFGWTYGTINEQKHGYPTNPPSENPTKKSTKRLCF